MAAGYMALRRAPHVQAAAQLFGRQGGRELVTRPAAARRCTRRPRPERRTRRSPPPQGRADPDHGAVVAMLDTHHQVRARAAGHEPGYRLLQLARRDLAGAAAAARILGEPERIRTSHAVKKGPLPEHAVVAPARRARMPGAASRASGSLKRDPARTSAAVACEAGVDPGTGSGHRAAMLGQLLLTALAADGPVLPVPAPGRAGRRLPVRHAGR